MKQDAHATERTNEQPSPNQHTLPDRWCFGLDHPRIQRLIFLAAARDAA